VVERCANRCQSPILIASGDKKNNRRYAGRKIREGILEGTAKKYQLKIND
jgi:hypothetical protein